VLVYRYNDNARISTQVRQGDRLDRGLRDRLDRGQVRQWYRGTGLTGGQV